MGYLGLVGRGFLEGLGANRQFLGEVMRGGDGLGLQLTGAGVESVGQGIDVLAEGEALLLELVRP